MVTRTDCPVIDKQMRRSDDPWRADITQSIDLLKAQHGEIRAAVDQNTVITNDIKNNTEEIIEFFKAGKGFFTTVGYVAKLAKWITAIAAAIGIVWIAKGDK